MNKKRAPITTHVLDLTTGKAAVGVHVALESKTKGKWKAISDSKTNADGRAEDLLPRGSLVKTGLYRLTFDIRGYRGKAGGKSFFPEVTVAFAISDVNRHHHVPLLLSAFGYSTYRGT